MRRVLMFTDAFPFGNGESFLETEIEYLAARFPQVVVIPAHARGPRRAVPPNVDVETSLSRRHAVRTPLSVLTLAAASPSLYRELLRRPRTAFQPAACERLASQVAAAVRTRDWLASYLESDGSTDCLLYTYWCRAEALGVAMIRERRPDLVFVSRAHGIDLYAERHRPAYLPMQDWILNRVNRLFTVSQHGRDYLVAKHPEASDRIEVARLGVGDPGFSTPASDDGAFRVVSCSSLLPVKRIELLIAGLAELARRRPDLPLEWTHIGDGPQRESLVARAHTLPSSVRWRFLGQLSNREVLDYYRSNPVDVLANVSESEGIPVSIMEALSCGIPVIATAVGGNPEIADNECGQLLSGHPSPPDVAVALSIVARDDRVRTRRERSRAKWYEKYNADRNYPEFLNRIAEIRAAAEVGAA